MFAPLFYLDLNTELYFNPGQKTHNPNFGQSRVSRPVDGTIALEGHFEIPLKGKGEGIILRPALPFRYELSAPTKIRDCEDQPMVHIFTVNPSFSVYFGRYRYPFDLTVSYSAPIIGANAPANHSVSFTGRLYINF